MAKLKIREGSLDILYNDVLIHSDPNYDPEGPEIVDLELEYKGKTEKHKVKKGKLKKREEGS